MGASNPRPSPSSSTSSSPISIRQCAASDVAATSVPRPPPEQNQPDGPSPDPAPPPLPSATPSERSTRQKYLQSLDFSLKRFLKASNLPGLEYRLRLAGFFTVTDLLGARIEDLVSGGFTMIMARRLLSALDEYIHRHLDLSEGMPLPFQLVRPGGKISSEPTERMKALPTFGKINVKRQTSLSEAGMKQSAGSPVGQPTPRSMAAIRLMNEEVLFTRHFPHTTVEQAVEGGQGRGGGEEEEEEEPDFSSLRLRRQLVLPSSPPLLESLRRTHSVPPDYRWHDADTSFWDSQVLVRHHSVVSMATEPEAISMATL